MRRTAYALAILAALGSMAAAEPMENFDFAKSACAPKAKGFDKAIAIRVFPHMSGDVQFSLRDGKTDWEKAFGLMGADEGFQFVMRGTYDGWAVYQLHDSNGPARFSVQYMFGDVNPAPHDCLVLPPNPEPVTVFEMAPVAVQMYLERLTGDGSGTPDQMRRRLLATVNPAEAAPPPPAPAAPQAAPTIANACGVPVIAALVEIGSQQPPKVFEPESINGRMEFNYLHEAGDEPLSVMCFRTKEESSLFRVPLPAGLTHCWFENGALSCSADAKASAGEASAAPTYVGVRPSLDGLPDIVGKEFVAWDGGCAPNGQGSFSEDYMTMADVDGDGRPDFILNGDGATCVENGKVVAMGGGNGGTSLTVFTHKGTQPTKTLSIFTQGAEIRAHKGFGTVTTAEGTYKLANGKATKVKKAPKGGKVVYTLGR